MRTLFAARTEVLRDEERAPGDEERAPGDEERAPGGEERAPGDEERAPENAYGSLERVSMRLIVILRPHSPSTNGRGASEVPSAVTVAHPSDSRGACSPEGGFFGRAPL